MTRACACSHETIYRSLFIQARGVLKKELMDHLRSKRRHAPLATCNGQRTVPRTNRRCHLDPGKARGSGRPSDSRPLEGDLLSGAKNSYIATLVERHSRFAMLIQGSEQRHGSCRCRLKSACSQTPRYPATLADVGSRVGDGQTQNFHRGHECKGLLLRSAKSLATGYERKHQSAVTAILPRGTDLSGYSQAQLDQVALRLNERPRKTLGFETPASRLQASGCVDRLRPRANRTSLTMSALSKLFLSTLPLFTKEFFLSRSLSLCFLAASTTKARS